MSTDARVAAFSDEASFTGERFLPQCSGEIAYEHWHRYAFARSLASGKTVLDVASGEGYGAALLSAVATSVHGVDIDVVTVERASRKYAGIANLSFVRASCTALPFPDRSFDRIVSFETIEHIDADEQVRMLHEFDRLLTPDGVLILSSPNKAQYSDARGTRNEFHVHELYRNELANLIARHFVATRWFSQRVQWWSGIWSETSMPAPIEALCVDEGSVGAYTPPQALYYVVVAARSEGALSEAIPRGSILTDRNDSVTKRYEAAVAQLIEEYKLVDQLSAGADRQMAHVQHLEALVGERDEALARQDAHVGHLEGLVFEKDRTIGAIGEQARALEAEVDRLRGVNLDHQSSIDDLQKQVARLTVVARRAYSLRWWLRFPLVRLRGERPPL